MTLTTEEGVTLSSFLYQGSLMPHVFLSQKLLLCMVVTSWCCRVSGTLPGRHLSEWALRNTEEIIKVKEI